MKFAKNILIMGVVASVLSACGIDTGLGPIDDVLSPRKTYVQDIRFINNSSETLTFSARLSQAIDYARCDSYADESKKDLAPGNSVDTHLSLKCREQSLSRSIVVTKHGNYATGTVDLQGPANVSKLPVGTQFKVLSSDRTQSVDLIVVANTYTPDSGNTTYWPTPSILAAAVAWISGTTLYVAIPLSFTHTVDIAFPKALGLSDFGNFEVRDEGGYFVSNMDYYEGVRVYPLVVGDSTAVTCDSIGCTSATY